MRNRSKYYFIGTVLSMLLSMVLAACGGSSPAPAEAEPAAVEEAAPPAQESGSTLQTVKDRGRVICVGNGTVPGFGFLDEAGTFTGFDIDFCRTLAAAIFGDAEAYEIRAATANERFTVLQSGEADVLYRNTTWTMSRDTDLGSNFGPTTFYDGQGLTVRKEDGFKSLEEGNKVSYEATQGKKGMQADNVSRV